MLLIQKRDDAIRDLAHRLCQISNVNPYEVCLIETVEKNGKGKKVIVRSQGERWSTRAGEAESLFDLMVRINFIVVHNSHYDCDVLNIFSAC